MNKLLGFYELKELAIPSIPWREYTENAELDSELLWTVRTAVVCGNDFNLPRSIGIAAKEACKFATSIKTQIGNGGLIIYYPYFIAEKSGTIEVKGKELVIEAVKEDLWNLESGSKGDLFLSINSEKKVLYGDETFLSELELQELLVFIPKIKQRYRDLLIEGRSLLLEWSFAYQSSIDRERIGDKHLIFYEMRCI